MYSDNTLIYYVVAESVLTEEYIQQNRLWHVDLKMHFTGLNGS